MGIDELAKKTKLIEKLFGQFKPRKLKVALPEFDVKYSDGFDLLKDDLEDQVKLIDLLDDVLEDFYYQAIEEKLSDLSLALDEAMESPVWDWDDGTRDIIDTGALKASKQVTFNRATGSLSINYSEPYANLVHFGGYIRSGYNPEVHIYIPPRPWVDAVLDGGYGIERFPFDELVSERTEELLMKYISRR